jgi:excisionase family DNA binding protein
MDDELLTVRQVAQKLQVHFRTVERYIREHKLKALRLGRYLRVRRSELNRFLSELETDIDTP